MRPMKTAIPEGDKILQYPVDRHSISCAEPNAEQQEKPFAGIGM